MNWIILQSAQLFVVSLPAMLVILAILGIVGLGLLWRKGKRIEAVLLLNTILLIIIIILLLTLR